MKKRIFLTAMTALPLLATAAVPQGEPMVQFKTMKGSREVENQRNIVIYVKSSQATGECYVQIGDTQDVDTVKITKANYLTKYEKKNLTAQQTDVKVWGNPDIWFLNVNGNDAYDLKIGQYAKENITEFRCENDSLTDMSFLNDMKKLEYLVIGGNRRVKKINLVSSTLQRFQLGRSLGLEEITVEAPELWEFKLEYSKITSLDFSKCPKLKNLVATNNRQIETINFGKGENLADVQFGGSDAVSAITVKNMPMLKKLAIHECPKLSSVEIGELPIINELVLRALGLKKFSISGFPSLRMLRLGENPFESLDINLPDLTSVTLDSCPLKEIDLTKMPALKQAYIRGGKVEKVNFNQNALDNTITLLYLNDNHIKLADLPAHPAKVRAGLNYYAPQRQPELPKSVKAGDAVDLSGWSKGNTPAGFTPSTIVWQTIFEENLQEGKDYTVKDGCFTFLHEIEDSIRCFITHPDFPSFSITKDMQNKPVDWRIISNYMVVKKGDQGVENLDMDDDINIYAKGGIIRIESEQPVTARIYSADGRKIYEGKETEIILPKGLYIVSAGGKRVKIML